MDFLLIIVLTLLNGAFAMSELALTASRKVRLQTMAEAGDKGSQAALDLLAHTLTNRLLHAPTVALREAALSGDGELPRAAEKLFPHTTGDRDA